MHQYYENVTLTQHAQPPDPSPTNMLFVRQKCRLRTELISSSGDRISPKIIQKFRYMTLLMHLSRLTRNDKFVLEIRHSVRKTSVPTPRRKTHVCIALTDNGCITRRRPST